MNDNLDLPGEYEEYRENLLNDFAEKLKDDPKTILYSEDEWIEIADYALDVDDRFLLLESILWGLSAYPNSAGLRDREAVLLSEFVDDRATAFTTLGARPKASKITRMLKFEATQDHLIPSSFYRSFKKAVIDATPLADHEIIELVRILADASCLDMMVEELPFWEKHVRYVQTLWYEIAACALDAEYYELGIDVIDKLLAEHPYNAEYWLIKAKLIVGYMTSGDVWDSDERANLIATGSEALENALAIKPDSGEAKRLTSFFGVGNDLESKVKFNQETAAIFRQAVDAENHKAVSELSKAIPQSWFNQNMDLMIYLSLEQINDPLSNKIINSWIQWTISELNENLDIAPQFLTVATELEAIGEMFCINNDHESLADLYARAENVIKKTGYLNPLDYEYAISSLSRGLIKEFNKVYKRLIKNYSFVKEDINVRLLTFFKDLKTGEKELCIDSRYDINRVYSIFLGNSHPLRDRISLPMIKPVAINFMTNYIFNQKFPKN